MLPPPSRIGRLARIGRYPRGSGDAAQELCEVAERASKRH